MPAATPTPSASASSSATTSPSTSPTSTSTARSGIGSSSATPSSVRQFEREGVDPGGRRQARQPHPEQHAHHERKREGEQHAHVDRQPHGVGDNGMISVVILRKAGNAWTIDTWLMSCRVLGRGVEQALLNEIVTDVLGAGGRRIVGIYRPTDRNEMVREHYRKLGFGQMNVEDDSSTSWLLDPLAYQAHPVPIEIIRSSTPSPSSQEMMRA